MSCMKEGRRRFTQEEYLHRQKITRESMHDKGIDLLIVYDPANMNWLTGYDGWSFYVHQCLVIGTEGELFWFGRGIDANGAKLTTDLKDSNIISYPDHYVQSPDIHPMEYLAGILKERQLHSKKIGLEKDNYYFSARAAESLYKSLPNVTFSDNSVLKALFSAIYAKWYGVVQKFCVFQKITTLTSLSQSQHSTTQFCLLFA